MKKKHILFVYRTPRHQVLKKWKEGRGPDSLLFGANHLKKIAYHVDFFDYAYWPFNFFHQIFYPLEHAIIAQTGMGFKIDQAMALLPKLLKYDVIVGTGDSAGLPLLALKYFKILRKPVIFMSAGLAGALKGKTETCVGKFYKKILPTADIFTSYAQIEIDFFEKEMGIKKGKIIYMPLATDWEYFSHKSKVKREIICSVGVESGRDYKTLFEAVKELPVKVEVACHPDNIKGLDVPSNVKLHLNIPVAQVLKIYQRSLLSIVPCFERYRSSGQMVLLESAAAGLPIIASQILGITTAFDLQNKKQVLFTKPESPEDLKQKIRVLLNDKGLRTRLARNASTLVKSQYTTYHLAKRLARFIDSL